MGTNYYALETECASPCAHCQQEIEWHVCKSLVMFEAHDTSPWGRIADWDDWKRVLLCKEIVIRDEYGNEHATDVFIADVEATDPALRGRQHQWLIDHGHSLDRDYLDSWGFSWHRGEFS